MEVQVQVKTIWEIGSKFVSMKYFHIYPNDETNRLFEINIYPLQLTLQFTYNPRIEIELSAFNYFSIVIGGGKL